jgi:hypothetical protein
MSEVELKCRKAFEAYYLKQHGSPCEWLSSDKHDYLVWEACWNQRTPDPLHAEMVEVLRKALEYYANDDNWKDRSDHSTDAHFMRSTVAKNALARIEKGE